MPPTLVHVAVGVLVGVALLGAAFDRRSLAVVALAAAVPDAGAVLESLVSGAATAALHSALLALAAVAVLYWDTERRSESRLRGRYGAYGARIAWVAVAAFAVAGIGLDLCSPAGVALLYPLRDGHVAVDGRLLFSTAEGVVQTYVEPGDGWLEAAPPESGEAAGGERRLRLVETGWQLALVATAAAAVPAKALLERGASTGARRGDP